MGEAKRPEVEYLYNYLNWDFIKLMAEIAKYADQKHGAAEQYTGSRLLRDKSPMNHIIEHYRSYMTQEPHDYFGITTYHLAAIAYNAMMEFYYHMQHGPLSNPFEVKDDEKTT